jgi:sulfite reductase (NADPH) hemoprotein beta-component
MGRTPLIGQVISPFVPWYDLLNYLEAVLRTYNAFGRRDNAYKARIKILVKAEGSRFAEAVEREFQAIVGHDGGHHRITVAELKRMQSLFNAPALPASTLRTPEKIRRILEAAASDDQPFERWLHTNVHNHKHPYLRAVSLSFKRLGYAPGDATADQLEAAADLIEQFSAGEARISHEQNLVLPWVSCESLPDLWREARRLGLAKPNIGLLTDMIACPGGDFCALANARSLPIARAVSERFQDLDELHDLGPVDLHISGCMNSCGHHHSGHIGILGVDKDGQEWYQITVGGADGSTLSGAAQPGRVIGPAFAAHEVVDAIEALLDTYRALREGQERFIHVVQRVGVEPFKHATQQVRTATARPA